jgi:beta-lactam-binding protein with PASTA domain
VLGLGLAAAKRKLARVNCRAGKVSRASSKRVKKGRVISQKPRFGAVLRNLGKVSLVISRGRRHS